MKGMLVDEAQPPAHQNAPYSWCVREDGVHGARTGPQCDCDGCRKNP